MSWRFNRLIGVDSARLERMDAAAAAEQRPEEPASLRHVLYLGVLALTVTWIAERAAPQLPEVGEVLSTSTWNILLVTTLGLALAFTPAKSIPGSHSLAMALVYVFVARMGASASLQGLDQAPFFLLGAFIWIGIHGLSCLAGAWLLKFDLHCAAIASAANVGGAASAPVAAAHHRQSLVPAPILMALLGYALGNYLALVAAGLCSRVAGI